MKDVLERVKSMINEEVAQAGYRVHYVLLFGSRARGGADPNSDWDFFVVIDKDLPFFEREDLASRICWRLAQQGIYADVFIQSAKTVEERRNNPGYLTYYVLKEGVAL